VFPILIELEPIRDWEFIGLSTTTQVSTNTLEAHHRWSYNEGYTVEIGVGVILVRCPHCQTEIPENAKFCVACGGNMRGEIVCPQCKHANPPAAKYCLQCGQSLAETAAQPPIPPTPPPVTPPASVPTSFANGRYQVKKFLGEGGKKKVYLAKDSVLDRDVAFALIKTEKLDEAGRTRIKREPRPWAQAMHFNLIRPPAHIPTFPLAASV
jgi:hypothetical protein